MLEVSVIIPTFRRPEMLACALDSCLRQAGMAPESYEIVVVDNCPDGSAQAAAEAAASANSVEITYVHEPRPGISWARNTGLHRARGSFAAFIDDDEIASRDWLRCLLNTQAATRADVVLAPVLPEITVELDPTRATFFRDFFTYATDHSTGTEIGSGILTPFWARERKAYPRLASGNALLRREAVRHLSFDPRLGLTGGEDTLFFNQLLADGRRIVWCREAVVTEQVPADRLSMRYVIRRAFRGGQITSRAPILLRRRQPWMTALSMALGAGQLAVHLPAALVMAGLRRPGRFAQATAAATALGKLLWMPPFRRRAYGTRTITASERAAFEPGGRVR